MVYTHPFLPCAKLVRADSSAVASVTGDIFGYAGAESILPRGLGLVEGFLSRTLQFGGSHNGSCYGYGSGSG